MLMDVREWMVEAAFECDAETYEKIADRIMEMVLEEFPHVDVSVMGGSR